MGRLLAIVALAVALDMIANAFLFERANQFSIRIDDAERIAEHLVIAHRLLDEEIPAERGHVADRLTTSAFEVSWKAQDTRPKRSIELDTLTSQVLELEPELRQTALRFHLSPLSHGGDIHGSMSLSDGSTVHFSSELQMARALNLERWAVLVVPTLLLVLMAALLVRAVLSPLRRLVHLSARVGSDQPRPIDEAGPAEVRQLIRAFNTMQGRIHELVRNRNVTVAALCHDLRTPLMRLRLRLDQVASESPEGSALMADLDELEALVGSMQDYLDGAGESGPRERVDLAVMAMTIVERAQDLGRDARYSGPDHLVIMARPLPLRRAIGNLVQNAIHYGGNAELSLSRDRMDYIIRVDDSGPGISDENLQSAVEPFVRFDDARRRDAPGMGLGLAIVDRIARTEGGDLVLRNREAGGLSATIRLPVTLHDPAANKSLETL
ncbi:ATP-binding protein [Croceicoccus gelatinilyticus]|uniref:ATP-binding protein n=1 Tax=Croceicoccus gelatinilyticus TaxID=2835536 RepID=UPI001BD03A0D|nr:ATP-binding protein [Croceicoccus gelatinilyticus]MBS7668697.1 HAMP domain-containing protein [Croceicoccus gelatinilyticus]